MFNELKSKYLKKNIPELDKFFEYFEKVWYETYHIEFDKSNKDDIDFRTNNICESYNKKLNKHIKITKPGLGFFVSKILELELDYRKSVLDSVNSGLVIVKPETDIEEKLCFNSLFHYVQKYKQEIPHYNLRSNADKDEFYNGLLHLTEECFNYFFPPIVFEIEEKIEEKKEEEDLSGDDGIKLEVSPTNDSDDQTSDDEYEEEEEFSKSNYS